MARRALRGYLGSICAPLVQIRCLFPLLLGKLSLVGDVQQQERDAPQHLYISFRFRKGVLQVVSLKSTHQAHRQLNMLRRNREEQVDGFVDELTLGKNKFKTHL